MKKTVRLSGIALFTLVLLSCNLLAPQSSPTPKAVDEATAIAGTVSAITTATAQAAASVEPTTTPAPTKTSLPPTRTPPPVAAAYIDSSQDLWFWSEGGSPLQLTSSHNIYSAYLSDDARRVAFVRHNEYRDYSLWVINTDGSGERELVTAADFNSLATIEGAIGAAPNRVFWVPGTQSIAYNTYPYFEGPGLILNNDLWLVNADSAEKTNLLPAGQGGYFVYSPDGLNIAVTTANGLSLVNARGEERRSDVLTYPLILTYSEYQYVPIPVWSPDSSTLRMVVPPEDILSTPLPATAVWQVPAAAGEPSKLADLPVIFLHSAFISPDTSQLAYLSPSPTYSTDNSRELRIRSLETGEEQVVFTGQVDFERWSPGSAYFAFRTGEERTLQIGQVGGATAAVSAAQPMNVLWLDETRFVFLARPGAAWELHLGTAAGGPSTLLASLGGSDSYLPSIDLPGE